MREENIHSSIPPKFGGQGRRPSVLQLEPYLLACSCWLGRPPTRRHSRCSRKEPSIYDGRKNFTFFYHIPPCPHFNTPSFTLTFVRFSIIPLECVRHRWKLPNEEEVFWWLLLAPQPARGAFRPLVGSLMNDLRPHARAPPSQPQQPLLLRRVTCHRALYLCVCKM